jgi:hypothetical protein
MALEGSGRGLTWVLFEQLPGGTKKNHKNYQWGQPVSWPRYEASTSQIEIYRYANLLGDKLFIFSIWATYEDTLVAVKFAVKEHEASLARV